MENKNSLISNQISPDCEEFITNMTLGTTDTGAASGAVLTQTLDHAQKMVSLADDLKSRHAELAMIVRSAYPKHKAVVARVKEVQTAFFGALSAHFDGRAVNLMGEINAI